MSIDKNELAKRYTTFTNDRLLEIVYNKDEYTPEAIEAVQAEINKRAIVVDDVNAFVAVKEEQKKVLAENALVPLQLWEKVVFFFLFLFVGLVSGAFRMNYKEDGMERKVRQARFYRIAGFVSILLSSFLAIALATEGLTLFFWIAFFGVALFVERKKY